MKLEKNHNILILVFIIGINACVWEKPSHNSGIIHEAYSPYLWTVKQTKAFMEKSEDVVLFQISKKEKFDKEHITGAFQLWRPDYENRSDYPYGGMMAKQEDIEVLLSQYGVESQTQIILYDTKGNVDAARFWWILRLYGHDKVAMIDGGIKAWKLEGLTTECLSTKRPKQSHYHFEGESMKNRLASFEDVQSALRDTNVIFLDTRELEEHEGKPYLDKGKLYKFKKGAALAGCIPESKFLNWSDAVDLKGDHRIKSIKDLKYNFDRAGVRQNKKIITYCQSGVRSAHTTFVLTELLGFPDVLNYDGSWIEWSYKYKQGAAVEIELKTNPEEVEQIYNSLSISLGNLE